MPRPSEAGPRPSRWHTALRWLPRGAAALLILLLLAAGVAWWTLGQSLPALEGALPLPGLSGPVEVARDALGVPVVRGATRLDVARATGFLHAQERFFQMDLLRRRSAGALAELVGAMALPLDRRTRLHQLRARAERALAALPSGDRALLEAYAAGVGAGLGALAAPPFEYLLLRADPAPWRPEDSLLVAYTMFIDLNGESGARDALLGVLRDTMPAEYLPLLAPLRGDWDAPLQGGPVETPALPGPEVLDWRQGAKGRGTSRGLDRDPDHDPDRDPDYAAALVALGFAPPGPSGDLLPGSNAWAVDGRHSAHGGALVADDMHLGLSVPNIWYRASLRWADAGGERTVTGVTLPGLPAVVAGSNGQVAWGFTNSYGDYQDLVELEPAPGQAEGYLTPDGPRPFERAVEVIRVKGGAEERLEVVSTRWGPVIDTDHRGRRRALCWTAHLPGALDLGLMALERARTLDEALEAGARAGMPPQNLQVADASGRIGWTIAGRLPRRLGYDGRFPVRYADGTRRWEGLRPPAETPRIADPPSGRLWTANARVVDGEDLATLGDGGYDLGARAGQIRERLFAREAFTEQELLAIQLDDRALFLTRWQQLLLRQLTGPAQQADGRRTVVRHQLERWGARASAESVGYRLVRAWRLAVMNRALAPFVARARAAAPRLDASDLRQAEGLTWRLVIERPDHLLPPGEASWDELLLGALDDVLAALPAQGADLERRTWGERNTAAIRHPLSAAVPGLGQLLDLPATPLPGDSNMPRVQGPTFGASERLVVSPGREAQGIFQMPGGQSGHPRSPFYRAGHLAWVRGEPAPFLPGPAAYTLRLTPP